MKPLKIILICLASIAIIFAVFKASRNIIEDLNLRFVPANPVVTKKNQTNEAATAPRDIDTMMSRSVNGIKERILPVKYEKNYTIYQGSFMSH